MQELVRGKGGHHVGVPGAKIYVLRRWVGSGTVLVLKVEGTLCIESGYHDGVHGERIAVWKLVSPCGCLWCKVGGRYVGDPGACVYLLGARSPW